MENLTGGNPPVRPLPCVVPCKLYFASDKNTCRDSSHLEVSLSGNGSLRKRNRDGTIWSVPLSAAVFYLTPEAVEDQALNPDWVEWLMGFPQGWTAVSSGPPTRRASPA